jgi:hypothetical protein
MIKNDPFGAAVLDYVKFKYRLRKIQVFSDVAGNEKLNPVYLLRKYEKMPAIEKKALDLSFGKVLDVGACAGSHTLYLQEKGLDVTALDISPGCCKAMALRGISTVICSDFFEHTQIKYDTLLFLMNGIGICGTLDRMGILLNHCRELLADGGQILFDSSNIEYMYYENDGSRWINLNSSYYGEVTYKLNYKNVRGKAFNWLFVDPETMQEVAEKHGFRFTNLAEGNHFDYLARLSIA